ncbi:MULTISPECIES: glycosyltransferase [Microbacterium]|uniref:Glycosyltransferase family 2 protein n=1 Tax=Microbacterium wangchenii TaxID=2541726 RepID=A0ABX5SSD1_9MICO|nr:MULTISPECIES: glycosyltransferase [Microbacterium]MCK6066799.1 glycosyltransferase [Microbacterium sp. EYE_512]QBR88116.1 glycosyltransferase family 2 protein [Microbacterium wangchenii]TXK18094.1 glycosyltransferase family 2 protein [Microbacterium wangchenii]
MPARVHAILVVRPEGRTPAAAHLRATLAALAAQTRPVDALTIVLCGGDAELREIAARSGAEGVITAAHGTGFAAATAMATPRLIGEAVWLLAQDTAPDPEALTRLAGALELAASVSFAAPKLVRWDDRSEIVSLGVSMSPTGRAIELAAGELDQGQHDAAQDVLGTDVRGVLVRREAWRQLGGLDPALAGADEGLDLGVRARLAGERVTLVPSAVVAVAGDGVAGLPAEHRSTRREFAIRTAELHRRLVYAPAVAVPLHWLSLLPLAVWRTIALLVAKQPGRVGPDWWATLVVLVRWGAVARARRQIRTTRRAGWSRLAPLRVSHAQLRLRWDGDGADPSAPVRTELRFFTGGGAWTVLAAAAVSVAVFPALLAWPVLGGGALLPLRSRVAQLWADAAYGQRALGLADIAPADPFAAVVAVVGTLSPADPSRALVILWLLALPLAVLGAWFAATRVTERSLLRILAAVTWALAPPFLTALIDGRPTAVLVHLLLPWLLYTGSVAHRSWASAGGASVLLVAVLACAPSLAPAVLVAWLGILVAVVAARRGRGVAKIVWLLVPTAVFFAPLAWAHARAGNLLAILADPGPPTGGAVAADAGGRLLLAAGFPTPDPAGWSAFLEGAPVWWVPLLIAPLALLALASLVTPRWPAAAAMMALALLGLATAFGAVGIAVSFAGSSTVPLWPGAGLSLAWAGALGAATVTLDTGLVPRVRMLRPAVALILAGGVAVAALPALTASARDAAVLTNGPASTLPAYVAAEGRGDARTGTIVIDPRGSGMVVQVVWGGSETLGGQSTLQATRTAPTAADRELAALAADLVTSTGPDAVAALAERGIGFVMLAAPTGDVEAVRALRLAASTALDQRDGLDAASRGVLWRVTGDVEPRPDASAAVHDTARVLALLQIAVVVIGLLLAVPTAASRRIARRTPRIVGPAPREAR